MVKGGYDAIWFGGGAAGRFGAAYMKALGGKPLIVEKKCLGGECHICRCAFENFVSDQSAMAEMMRIYSGRSWYPKIDLSNISMAKAVELYRKVGGPAFRDTMKHQTEIQLGIEVAWGEGKILDKNRVEVNGQVYEGKNLIVGTGSRPTMPDIPGIDLPGVMTYIDHAEMTKDTKKMVIIGGGKIGIGKAAMFAPFNTDVTVLEKYTVLPKWDRAVRNFVGRDFNRRGIKVYQKADVKEIKGKGKVEAVVAEIDGKRMEFPCDTVMVSIGLTPNSECAKPLGIKIGYQNEIVVNDRCQTNVQGIYGIGDAAGPPYFMAVARKRGMITAKNIMGIDAKWDDSLPLPDHMYLPPLEALMVGLTEEEARKKYGDVVLVEVPWGPFPEDPKPETYYPGFENHGLPVCGRMHTLNLMFYGQNRNGLMKAIVDPKSRKYLGFHSVSDGAKTGFQYLSYFLKIGWTVDQMADLHEIFLNAEHFVQLSRLIAGQKELKGYAAQVQMEEDFF